MWLIVIDGATKWPEVIRMNNNMAAEWIIDVLQSLFSRLGLPNQIVSGNGPQFTSEAYQLFLYEQWNLSNFDSTVSPKI